MKKFKIALLIFLTLGLAACAGGGGGGSSTGTKVDGTPDPEPEPEPEVHQYVIRLISVAGTPFRAQITRNVGTPDQSEYNWHYNVAGGQVEDYPVGYNMIILFWNDGAVPIEYIIYEDSIETQRGTVSAGGFANINQGYTGP